MLVDLVNGEVLRVDVGLQLRFERCPDLAESIPLHAPEEGVLLDLMRSTNTAKTVFGIADETSSSRISMLNCNRIVGLGVMDLGGWRKATRTRHNSYSPPDEVLGLGAKLLVGREVEVAGPVDDLAVGVVRLLSAERRPADEALEHDGTDGPPIAAVVVTLSAEDLGSDIVGCTDGGVRQLTTGLAPAVDLCTVADRELDLIDGNRVAVVAIRELRRVAREELLIVGRLVFLVETGRKAEVSELDVSAAVEKDVVGFNVTAVVSHLTVPDNWEERRCKRHTDV